ncbi:MAG: hypothetical protein U0401_16395 [Anaerolineae bacterium]
MIANTAPDESCNSPARSPQASGTFYGNSDYQGVLVCRVGRRFAPQIKPINWLIPPPGREVGRTPGGSSSRPRTLANPVGIPDNSGVLPKR